MGLSLDETRRKIANYEAGTSNDLDGVHELTAERLRAQRARREEIRQEFDARQAEESKRREEMTKARYLAAGNTEADWKRDRDRVLSDAAIDRMRTAHGGALISPAEMLG